MSTCSSRSWAKTPSTTLRLHTSALGSSRLNRPPKSYRAALRGIPADSPVDPACGRRRRDLLSSPTDLVQRASDRRHTHGRARMGGSRGPESRPARAALALRLGVDSCGMLWQRGRRASRRPTRPTVTRRARLGELSAAWLGPAMAAVLPPRLTQHPSTSLARDAHHLPTGDSHQQVLPDQALTFITSRPVLPAGGRHGQPTPTSGTGIR